MTSEPDEFIVNIGDMMQRWTNDRWTVQPAPRRQSRRPEQRKGSRRMSIGYFLHPNYDAEIACLPTCTGPEHRARYPPVRAGDMMRQEARGARGVNTGRKLVQQTTHRRHRLRGHDLIAGPA